MFKCAQRHIGLQPAKVRGTLISSSLKLAQASLTQGWMGTSSFSAFWPLYYNCAIPASVPLQRRCRGTLAGIAQTRNKRFHGEIVHIVDVLIDQVLRGRSYKRLSTAPPTGSTAVATSLDIVLGKCWPRHHMCSIQCTVGGD